MTIPMNDEHVLGSGKTARTRSMDPEALKMGG